MSVRTAKKKYDVVVVGGGPMGWCTAQLLSQSAVKTLLIEPESLTPVPFWMNRGLGVFWPSLNDPPTRALVAHGPQTAQWLQDFCSLGTLFASSQLGPRFTQVMPAFRLGLETHDINELNIARQKQLGLTADPALGVGVFKEDSESRLLLNRLGQELPEIACTSELKSARVTALRESQQNCILELDTGEVLSSEMVVLAMGHQLAQLCPWLQPMLVPMLDVKTEWHLGMRSAENARPFSLRVASGHVAAVFCPKQSESGEKEWHVSLTGPRFFLPRAGVGLSTLASDAVDTLIPKIQVWLRDTLLPRTPTTLLGLPDQTTLTRLAKLQFEDVEVGVDCLPCDELPVLGELGTQGRILGGAGWLGCGWSAGFHAAQIVTDLVLRGKSEKLLPLLKPQRWRSGMNDGVTGMT